MNTSYRCGKEVDTRKNIGDIAVVEDSFFKRNYWRLGKITRLIKEQD